MHSAPETAWSRCHLTRQERTAATRSERHEPARERARFGTALADALARARAQSGANCEAKPKANPRARSLARSLASAHPPRWPPLASGHSRNERTLCGITLLALLTFSRPREKNTNGVMKDSERAVSQSASHVDVRLTSHTAYPQRSPSSCSRHTWAAVLGNHITRLDCSLQPPQRRARPLWSEARRIARGQCRARR